MEPAQDVSFFYTVLPAAGIVFAIAVGVIFLYQHFRKNLYRQMLEQEELKNKYQNDLLRSTIEVQEAERKRIAQDMHDELGATLSIARMQLVQIEQQQHNNSELTSALHQVRITTEAALATMRRLSHELMPPQLQNFGLVKTMESVSEQINSSGSIKLTFTSFDDQLRLPVPAELALYRICMEFINNTFKHAGARNISITLSRTDNHIQLTYEDDGKGLPDQRSSGGLGFRSAEARVNSVSGSIQIGNGKNGGFTAFIKIPIQV